MSGVPSMKTSRAPISSFGLYSTSGLFELGVGAHHAGQRVVVGDADRGKPQFAGLMHILLRMRAAAQEREVGGDADLGIADVKAVHANSPCTNQLAERLALLSRVRCHKALAVNPEAAARLSSTRK